MLQHYYTYLAHEALKGDERSLNRLLYLFTWDERVAHCLSTYGLNPTILDAFLNTHSETLLRPTRRAWAARYLSQTVFYDKECGDRIAERFARICQILSLATHTSTKVATAELLIHIARLQPYRSGLFDYSESFRHLLQERDPFYERAVCGCLAYLFCDDYLGESVTKLQYKTDVLNYINKLFLETHDFSAWRYSVRCLSLAAGYNEDKTDVDETRKLIHRVSHMLPEFTLYFLPTFIYARIRHIPRGPYIIHVPRWVAFRRALLGATFCGLLGVYSGSWTTWKLDHFREKFALARQQEMRRRRGSKISGKACKEQHALDDIKRITQTIFLRQYWSYTVTLGALFLSLYPLRPVRWPGWCGDVKWNFPLGPVLFPLSFGVAAPYKRLIPYILVPFCGVKLLQFSVLSPCSPLDYMRY